MAFGVTCPTCGKAFSVTDEIYQRKVQGRVVTIKCKQCQAGIRVDATKPNDLKITAAAKGAPAEDHKSIETKSVGPSPAAMGARIRQATLIGVTSPVTGQIVAPAPVAPPSSAPPPPPPPTPPAAEQEGLWAVETTDGSDLELSWAELRREIESGKLAADCLVWREGMGEWLEISKVPELAGFLKKAPAAKPAAPVAPKPPAPAAPKPPPPAPTPPAPAAKPVAPPPPRARTLSSPGSEEVPTLPKPAPRGSAPSMSDEVPTAPKGAPPLPPAPAPSPKLPEVTAPISPATADAPAPNPFTSPSPAPIAAAPNPFTSPSPAPIAAPAPAVLAPPAAAPRPIAAPQAITTPEPLSADFDFPKPRSKAPIVVALLAVVGIAIGAAVMLNGGEPTLPPPAPAPAPIAQPTATTTTTATATSLPTEPSGTATAPSGDSTAGAPETTPGAGFAEMFAAAAKNAEGSAAPAARFDAAVARKALAGVLGSVATCKEAGGPRGKLEAVVAFDPSGKVSSVTISDAPFAGTSTASCAAAAFKKASMPPFKGLPGTVSQVVSLR